MFSSSSHLLLHRCFSSYTIPHSTSIAPVRSSSSVQDIRESTPESKEQGGPSSQLYSSTLFPPIKAAKRVVLVRHGQSTWNEEGRIQGSSNFSVLTQKGEAQAETSRQMLADDAFDVCFSRLINYFFQVSKIPFPESGKVILFL